MKRLLIATVAAAGLLAASSASADTQPIVVNATVAPQCGLGNQTGGGTTPASTPITLGAIVDANGFLVTSGSTNIDFGNVWCNAASTMSITVTPLTTSSVNTDSGSFLAGVDMVVDNSSGAGSILQYMGATSVSSTGGVTPGSFSNTVPGAFETGTGQYQQADLHLAYPTGHPGNDRPLAGAWTGTVTLTATAN